MLSLHSLSTTSIAALKSLHASSSSLSFFPSRNPRSFPRVSSTIRACSTSSSASDSDEPHELHSGRRRTSYAGVRLDETVDAESGKIRLDSWISSRIDGVSRARVQSSIRTGLVSVNGRVIDKVRSVCLVYWSTFREKKSSFRLPCAFLAWILFFWS